MAGMIEILVTGHPWSFGALSFVTGTLIGGYVNHRFSVERDRAKDFNALADPARTSLRRELQDLRANAQWTKGDDLALLIEMSLARKRSRLRDAVTAYKMARKEHLQTDSYGQQFFTRTDHVEKAIRDLLPLLSRR